MAIAFSIAAARVWNSFPLSVTSSASLPVFRSSRRRFYLFAPSRRTATLFYVSYCHLVLFCSFMCFSIVRFSLVAFLPWSCSLMTLRHVNLIHFYIKLHYITLLGVHRLLLPWDIMAHQWQRELVGLCSAWRKGSTEGFNCTSCRFGQFVPVRHSDIVIGKNENYVYTSRCGKIYLRKNARITTLLWQVY